MNDDSGTRDNRYPNHSEVVDLVQWVCFWWIDEVGCARETEKHKYVYRAIRPSHDGWARAQAY